jgi:hypothetical protein
MRASQANARIRGVSMRIEHFEDKNASLVEDLAIEFLVKRIASIANKIFQGHMGL